MDITRAISTLLALSALYANPSLAENIFETKYAHQADVKVHIVKYKHMADLCVYVAKYPYEAQGKDEIWHYVKYESASDARIFFVKYSHQADVLVYFVDYKHEAGWRTSNRFRGWFK